MTAPVSEHSPALDPRIRARRREIQRHRGRRRLRRLQAALATAAAGAGAWGVALSPVADVDRVRVQGADRTGAAVVEEATGITHGDAMVSLDLGAAADAVEALPWVATATMVRAWPGTVVVTVAERRPVAVVIAEDGNLVVVDGDGRQLAFVGEDGFPELPRVVGVAAAGQPGAGLDRGADAALQLAQLLAAAIPLPAAEIAVVGGDLQADMAPHSAEGARVRFGTADGLADKVTALATLVQAGVLDRAAPGSVLDLRVPDAPVLTHTEG